MCWRHYNRKQRTGSVNVTATKAFVDQVRRAAFDSGDAIAILAKVRALFE